MEALDFMHPRRPLKVPQERPGYLDDALKRLDGVHRRILERRLGVPIDVDALLDELRGYSDSDGAS